MTMASFVISCLALIVASVAVWYGRGQKLAADRSAAQAKRAADAAADLAIIEHGRRAEELAAAERNRVRFTLDPAGGSAYILRNLGTHTAYGVHVDTGGLGTLGEQQDFPQFTPDDEYQYLLSRTLDMDGTERVTVTWHLTADLSSEPHTVKFAAW